MTEADRDGFFVLHADLPREGPGDPADVAWAADLAATPATARILDAACGPGGDIGALLRAAPEGQVTAVDLHAPFVAAVRARWGRDARVTPRVGDMTAPSGPFDLIWCAGAVYFPGIAAALTAWRGKLAPGGAVAFSEPCHFIDAPSDGARAFWAGEGFAPATADGIRALVGAAGYRVLGDRPLGDAAWENYYRPLEARCARLRATADARLSNLLDETAAEIAAWRAHKAETGYLLCVVRPE